MNRWRVSRDRSFRAAGSTAVEISAKEKKGRKFIRRFVRSLDAKPDRDRRVFAGGQYLAEFHGVSNKQAARSRRSSRIAGDPKMLTETQRRGADGANASLPTGRSPRLAKNPTVASEWKPLRVSRSIDRVDASVRNGWKCVGRRDDVALAGTACRLRL